MEKIIKTPPKIPTADTENHRPENPNTPPPGPPPTHNSGENGTRHPENPNTPPPAPPPTYNSGKNGAPDRLKVPKPFKYPERYTSPTDQMMSPVTRGILARSRKGSKRLPPSAANQIKIQTLQIQDLGALPN